MKKYLILIFINTQLYSYDKILESTLNRIETSLNETYLNINSTSKYLDEFLSNKKDNSTYKNSYINFELSAEKKEYDSINLEKLIEVKLDLPKIKEKLSFEISNKDIINEYNQVNDRETKNTEDLNIGIVYNLLKNHINIKSKIGVRFSNKKFLFSQLSIGKIFNIDTKNIINIKEILELTQKEKIQNTTSIDYSYKISDIYTFTNYNEYNTNTNTKSDNYYNSLKITQKYSKKEYLDYIYSIKTNNLNTNLKIKEYKASIGYKKYLKKWLYLNINPNIYWDISNNYKKSLGIKIAIGIEAGNR